MSETIKAYNSETDFDALPNRWRRYKQREGRAALYLEVYGVEMAAGDSEHESAVDQIIAERGLEWYQVGGLGEARIKARN